MKNKLFLFSFLIISGFIFSACTINKTDTPSQITPTSINQETGDDTEAELQQQLNADQDASFDSDLNNLQTELAK